MRSDCATELSAPVARPAVPPPTLLARWAVPLALVALTVCTFGPMLGQHLQSDDFAQILTNRDLGFDGFVRFLLTADYGGRPHVYWRPAWAFTFWLLHGAFGIEPAPYQAFALALHTAHVLGVWLVARWTTGSTVLAAAAAALFALHPAHAEAVLWVAAATNVIPAATLLLFAAWCTWSFATGAPVSRLWCALALGAASFAWKEAAYGFPLALLAGWCCGRTRGPWSARDTAFSLATAGFVALVLLHYTRRNSVAGFAGSATDFVGVCAASLAGSIRQLAPPIAAGDVVLAAIVVVAAAALFVWSRPAARFWVVATVAGTLPYTFVSSGSRFSYFFHGPLCVLLAACAARWFAVQRSAWRLGAAAAALVLPLWLAPAGLRDEIARFRRDGEQADRIVTALVNDGLARADHVVVDVMPDCLVNGFDAALALRTGHEVRVAALQLLPRPPFMIHIDVNAPDLDADSTILRLDAAAGRYVPERLGDRLGGLAPVPLFALCTRHRIVVDEAAARALVQSGAVVPGREVLLYEPPPIAPDPNATGTVHSFRTDVRDLGATVECNGTMLLVVAFPLPVDFHTPPGAILVDGEATRVLPANILFDAIALPAGKHDVRLVPRPIAPR